MDEGIRTDQAPSDGQRQSRPLRISTEAFDRAREIAPGWDRYALENIYIGWPSDKDAARNEDARFLGWVKSYTKGRPAA